MKFFDTARPLYLETDESKIGLGVVLLQVRDSMNCGHDEILDNTVLQPIAFPSKGLSSVEQCYSNIECQVSRTQHWLKKFNHNGFPRDVCIITDHKPLVAIVSKDMPVLSQWLQCTLL